MRVVLGLLLLAGLASAAVDTINPDANNVFHLTSGTIGSGGAGANPTSGYIFTGTPNGNPTLNMTIGTTYYISIEFDSAGQNHPFGLSTSSTGNTVNDNGLTVNATSGPCGTTTPNAFTFGSTTGPFCVLKFVAPNTTTPLYYHCAVHSSMVGALQLNAPAAPATNGTNNGTNSNPTTPVPTNNGTTNGTNPTTPVPTTTSPPTTPAAGSPLNADNTNTFHVTGSDGSNAWLFTSGGVQYPNPQLNMAYGQTYKISIEFNTQTHPFGLSKSGSGTTTVSEMGLVNANGTTTTCGGSAANGYTSTTTCVLTFTPPANTPQPLYYHCAFHQNMVGQIVVSGLPKSSGFALVPGFAALFAIIAALLAQ